MPKSTNEEIVIMSEHQFSRRTQTHRTKLICWFVGSFAVLNVTFAVKEWSYNIRGWEAEVVYVVFYIIFAISALSTLMFGALLYGWFKEIKPAKRDRENHDSIILVQMRRSVFGPIPWK